MRSIKTKTQKQPLTAMPKKKVETIALERLLNDLTREEINVYLELFHDSFGLARHDFANRTSLIPYIAGEAQKNIRELISELDRGEVSKAMEQAQALGEAANKIRRIGEALHHQVQGYFNLVSRDDIRPETRLSASPRQIFQDLTFRFPKTSIQVSKDSPKTLYIPFPNAILHGIMAELVSNSVRHGEHGDVRIKIEWKITTEGFLLLVSDSNTAARCLPYSFISYGSLVDIMRLRERKNAYGLRMISRLLAATGGSSLFSRSRELGGLLVRAHIPINSYVLRGRFRQVREGVELA